MLSTLHLSLLLSIAKLSQGFLRSYTMSNVSLSYDNARLHCKLQFGPSATLASYTGYPPEEKALMKLCGSTLTNPSKSCWVNSPSRNRFQDPLCSHLRLAKQPETDVSTMPSFGSLGDLESISCLNETRAFVCAHSVAGNTHDPVLQQCLSTPPSRVYSPSTDLLAASSTQAPSKGHGIVLSWFIAATNDEYGSLLNENGQKRYIDLFSTLKYRSASRSAASLAAVVHGSGTHGLLHSSEILLIDWGSDDLEPLRCTDEFRHVLSTVPKVCSGDGDSRKCSSSLLRIIQVDRETAQRHALGSPVSEVHTINLAARVARGKMILRIDQDTLTRTPFFRWLHFQQSHGFPDVNSVWWMARDSGLGYKAVMDVPFDIRHYVKPCDKAQNFSLHSRVKYDRVSDMKGDGGNWSPRCDNGAVGVYGYPTELLKDVMGFNEKYYFWGGMEGEFCGRAKNSSKYHTWIDLRPEIPGDCGPSFTHMQHGYGERRQNSNQYNQVPNDPALWGLVKDTLIEYIY